MNKFFTVLDKTGSENDFFPIPMNMLKNGEM